MTYAIGRSDLSLKTGINKVEVEVKKEVEVETIS